MKYKKPLFNITQEYIDYCKEHTKITGSNMYSDIQQKLADGKCVIVDKGEDIIADYTMNFIKEYRLLEKAKLNNRG
jgi:hypothetical protein